MSAKVIAFCNQKGGVGKTTSCLNIGVGLAAAGKRVLLIDADPQGSLSISLGIGDADAQTDTLASIMVREMNREQYDVRSCIRHHAEGVDYLPANIELASVDVSMINTMSREYILSGVIAQIRDEYDFILIDCIPCEIVELSHDDAVLRMVESNFQRSEIMPSEKAFAYKMRLDALRRKAGRNPEKELGSNGAQLTGQRSSEQLAAEAGESAAQIKRYVRLTYLLPELLEMVDSRQLGFRPAVELFYLNEEEQKWLLDGISSEQTFPSLAQAGKIRRFSATGNLNSGVILSVLMESKPQTADSFKLPRAKFAHYFKENAKPKEIEDTIEKALKQYFGR